MRFNRSFINALCLLGTIVFISCSKGKSTVDQSKERNNYSAKNGKNYENVSAGYTFSENIEFFVTSDSSVPLPEIGSEFRAFDISALFGGATSIAPEKIPAMLKSFQDNWNTSFFILDADGGITTNLTCDNGVTREACVGALTGSSSKTDRDGRAFTGYRSPDRPGAVIAVVLKVPEGSSASNLMQYSTIQVQSWKDWGKRGESPLEASLLLVPQLENDLGEPVVKAGSGFSVNLIIPGIPSTPKGEGYLFDIETTGVELLENDRVVIPSGKNVKCNFRNGVCSLPGGPFKVLFPTTMIITVKPSDPQLPVKVAKLEIPVITGKAKTIMLSTTYPANKITNLCTSESDFSKPCFEISADVDELAIYPFLADEGGNFVGFTQTEWSATGPLSTRLESQTVSLTQTIKPQTPGSGIIYVSTANGISSQYTYRINTGVPAKVEFKTERAQGSISTEKVGVPFRVISTLYDRKDNLCVDYNTSFGIKMKLSPVYPAAPPAGVTATAAIVDQIDQTVTKIQVTNGIGVSTQSFSVAKVPDLIAGQNYPSIQILSSTLSLAVVNSPPITILPGVINQSLLRNSSGGLGTSWDEVTSGATGTLLGADRTIAVRSDQRFFFNLAGYDAGGNYVSDIASKFWGVSYQYHTNSPTEYNALVSSLSVRDPSVYNSLGTCPNPTPDAMPPSQVPTNQPESNKVYCGIHRGLQVKQGFSTIFESPGIPGAGRVLAIPLDSSVKSAISPRLNVTSGTASKMRIDLLDTNPAANPLVLLSPIPAGKQFRIQVTATDNDGNTSSDFTGAKTLSFSGSALASWGGVNAVIPNGDINCTFASGVCIIPGPYLFAKGTGTEGNAASQAVSSIAIEQVLASGEAGVVGIQASFFRSIPGAAMTILLTDKKGGPSAGALQLNPISNPEGIAMNADQEYGFAVAITDALGNFVRDAAAGDNIQFNGFEGTLSDLTGTPGNYFNLTTRVWSTMSWPAQFTENNLFTANLTPPAGLNPTAKKFYDPSVPADASSIATVALRDSAKYSFVFVPQNRVGKGFAVPYSVANASLKGWPSPLFDLEPGAPDFTEVEVFHDTDTTINNSNITAGACNKFKLTLNDRKGNQAINYSTVTNLRLKIFNVNASKPNGVDDPFVGASNLTETQYSTMNKSEIPGPINSGFQSAIGFGGADLSVEAAAKFSGSYGDYLEYDANYASYTSKPPRFADWWSTAASISKGQVTLPGEICLQEGQTLANRLSTPVSQKIVQVEIAASTFLGKSYSGLISRGAGRTFSTSYGSTSPVSFHNDILTVKRGAAHHLHGAYADDFQNPELAWLGATLGFTQRSEFNGLQGDQLGVESPCPYPEAGLRGGCGSKIIYWHIHDSSCNYLGPATSVVQDGTLGQSKYNMTPAAAGAEGSSAFTFTRNDKMTPTGGANNDVPYNAYVTNGTLKGSWYAYYRPGRPDRVGGSVMDGQIPKVDNSITIGFWVRDQFNNNVLSSMSGAGWESASLARNPYGALKTRKVWTDVLPPNAASGEAPTRNGGAWGFNTYANAISLSPSIIEWLNTGEIRLYNASNLVTFYAEFVEETPSVWCTVAGRCPTTSPRTFNGSFEVAPLPGPAIGIELFNANGASGLPMLTANFPTIFPSYPLAPDLEYSQGKVRSCLQDSFKNSFECGVPSTWSIVDSLDDSGNATSDHPIAMKLAGGATPPVTQASLEFYPSKSGSSKISVTRGSFTKVSDPISVNGGPLDFLQISSFGTADNPLAPITLSAGQELPIRLCLADATGRVISSNVFNGSTLVTNPNLTYNVTFSAGIIPNREDKSVILSTAAGASFDSNSFGPGTKALAFVSGCKDLYLKALASGTVSGSRLLTVTTSDPLRPSAQITAKSGLSVSTVTPGALNGFVTTPMNTSNTPVLNSVPAWSNVQADAGYASVSGNRFDLKIEARDAYGNNLNATTTVNLTRVRDDGVTSVSRQMFCQGETTTAVSSCLTVNFSNVSEVIVTKLASDLPGKMYIIAHNGSVGTRLYDSRPVNFQVTAQSIASYSIMSIPPSVEAGQPFMVSIAALDSTGSIMNGIDSELSAKTFSARDNLGANLTTHLSPNLTAPTLPTTFTFTGGIGTASLTLTNKENLSLRVQDASAIQSPLVTINVFESLTSNMYQISCKLSGTSTDCSGTSGVPFEIAASRANLLDLTVTKTDAFGNKKNSLSPLYIKPIYISGSSLKIPGRIHSTTAKSYVNFSDDYYISFSIPSENGVTLDNLYYGVGNQTVTFDLPSKETLASIDKNIYIKFLPHIDTVYAYELNNFGSSTFFVGTVKNFKVRAFDVGGNSVTGVDSQLSAQTYTWSGGSGISPWSYANVIPTAALNFTNGLSQSLSATFYVAKTYTFLITDNWSNSVKLDLEDSVGARSNNSTWYTGPVRGAITVNPNPPSSYAVTINTTQQAGVPFNLTLAARDLYGNLILGWTDSLTFSYLSGASPSIANPKNSSVFTATKAPNTTNTEFTYGLYTPAGNPFTLYRSNLLANGSFEVTQLKIQGTNTSTASGTALATTVNITTTPDTDVAYAKITSDPVYSAATELSNRALNYSTSSTYNYYNYLFDQFGNMKAPSGSVLWTGTGALANKMAPTSGSQTLVSPVASGSGTIKADCSAISGCIDDETGTISLGSGPLDRFLITDPVSTTANLGQEIPVTICMADAVGVPITTAVSVNSLVVTDPDATIPLELRQINITDTPETQGIEFSKASGAGFDAGIFNSITGTTNFTFASGCTTVYAKIYSTNSSFGAANLLRVRYDDPNQPLRGTISSSGLNVPDVAPLGLDHYVTRALNTATGYYVEALANVGATNVLGSAGGNRFDLQVFARDIYGNSVVTSNTVALSIVRSNGTTALSRSLVCAAPANDTSCLNPTFSASSSLVVNNLALDVAGSYYVKASTGGIGIASQFSDLINFKASPYTVKKYVISHPAQVIAGEDTSIQIRAEDNSGGLVLGADSSLGSLTYTFYNSLDATLMSTHKAPDLTDPIMPTSLSFSGGVAYPTLRFVKSETGLNLNVRDNFTVQNSSTNLANLNVNPGNSLYYDITCRRVSDASDCTGSAGSPVAMTASAADKFDLEFRAYDLYKNPKLGDGSAKAVVTRLSGSAASTGILETITGGYTYISNSLDVNMATLDMVPKSGMFYRVGNQTIDISLSTSGALYYRKPNFVLTPTIDTVGSFVIGTSASVVAGQAIATSLQARDSGWNYVTGIDASLNALSFTWSGLSNSPSGSAPIYPPSSVTFVGGIATGLSITYKKAETANLLVTDNYAPCGGCSNVGGGGTAGKRNNYSGSTITISHAPSASYSLTGSSSPKAGIGFDMVVTALDEFQNPATSWASDTLTFTWSGANASASNQVTASMSPTVLSSGLRTFSAASFTTSSTPFALYKVESPTLTVSGTVTAQTKNTAALTGTRTFTVLPSDTAAYVKLSDSSNPLNATLSGAVFSQQTDQTKTLFAHLYDPYANIKSNNSLVGWSGSSVLAGKLSPATGSNTVFAPTTSGTGVITASCTSITAGCQPDSTGTLTIDPSNVSKIVYVSPSPSNNFTQLTTACQELKVQTQDLVNNPANVNSDSVFTFTSTGGNGDFYATSTECATAQAGSSSLSTSTFHTSTLGGSAGSRTKTMTTGTNVLSVWFANRTAVASNAAQVTVAALSRTAILNATISPDTARRVSFITTTPTVNAVGSPSNTCIALTYRFNDIWGNQQSLASASTINLSVTGTNHGGTIHSDSSCTTGISSRSLSSENQDTVYYKDTKANRSTFNILSSSTLNGSAIQAASTIDINVLPGAFTITETPTSGSYTKDTVTLYWSASAGVNNYSVSYGATSACGITISTSAAGTSISFATGLNGLYYICVVANSFTSGGVNLNAANHGTYNFYIDNLLPTGAITAPTLANIGPVTTEVGGGASTRTFTGNASDTGGAGLSKVELEIKDTTANKFWDGSVWTTTASVVLATGTSSWSYSILNSNFTNTSSYTVRAQITDLSGNVTSNAATRGFTWDTAAPTANITAFGALLSSTYYSNATNLNATITTSTGAITYRHYTVAGSSCSGGTYLGPNNLGTAITTSPGVDGQYTLCVIGKDQAENEQASPTAFTWIKDTVAPTISGGVPNMGPVNAAFTPSLAVATDTTPAAGSSVISYLWTTPTNATNCTTAFGNTTVQNTSITSTCSSGFGISTLNLRVSDTAGNFTNYSPTFNWDSQPRTISNISTTLSSVSRKAGDVIDIDVTFTSGSNSANVVVAGGTPTLALNTTPAQSASYLSGSGTSVLRFRYTVQATDNVATLNVSGTSALSYGGATIKDTYGTNVSLTTPTGALNTRNITIDTVAPTLSFTGLPSSESNVTTLAVGISATDTSTYTYAIVQGTNAACPGTQSGSISRTINITNSISGMSEGDITLCAQATDVAGNVQSGYTTYTWKKDTVAPAVPAGVAPAVEVNTLTPTITWNAAAADVTNLKVVVYSNTGLSTSVYDSGMISYALTSQAVSALPRDGKYFICVTSRDLAGNWSTCSPTTFSVETDTIHLSWFESGNVQYALKDKTSAWSVSTAATGLTYQGRTSIAVDSSGKPAIGYGTTNGTNSNYRYSRWDGTAWNPYILHTTSNNLTGGTLGALVVASITPTFQAGFLAIDANSTSLGVQTGTTNSSNALNPQTQAFVDNGLSYKDLGVFIDSNNIKYTMATPSLSGVIRPVITETSSLDPFTPVLPTNCTQMPYVSGVSRQSGSSFSIAGICVMSDSSCQIWHGASTFTTAPSWTAMTWTNLGTARASGCTVGNLTLDHRPSIMQDKQTDKSTVVFTDITNNKIVRASNESGSWVNEDVKTGLTGTFGSAFVAIDQYSRSYVSFADGGALYMINNNGREHPQTTGGWNTPTLISNTAGISGFAGPAINGMKGRGNFSGGK